MQKAIIAVAVSAGLAAMPLCTAIAQGPANQNQTPQVIGVSAKKYEFACVRFASSKTRRLNKKYILKMKHPA